MYVSIHAPAKGATANSATDSFEQNLFQSTLLRKERLAGCNFCYTCNVVSIHAPAKGATVCAVEYGVLHANVSIHAPAKGATRVRPVYGENRSVSIHAPAKGATASDGI